jgi:uncharacterized protein (TIGR02145 family)
MSKNLNVGTKIDNLSSQTNNSIIEKYCYEFDDAKCDKYGGLYQWDELMQYNVTDDNEIGITQGICPPGWHIPTSTEWITIASFLGGKDIAGGKMKSTGTIQDANGDWNEPNEGATNESAFTGLPSGTRDEDGITQYEGYTTFFWSATSNDGLNPIARSLGYQYTTLDDPVKSKDFGYSVRCIKDIVGSK